MNYYTYTGNKMYVAHFSGATKEIFPTTIDKVKDITFNMPEDLSIITAITDDVKSDSPIIYQLNKNKTSYINMADRTEWSDLKKLEYIIQGLQNASTEYCLIVDGLDVVITGDMDEALGIFKNMDYDVLFNASMYNTPKEDIEDIGDREQYGKFRYFNDGCCIGKTASLLKVYQDAYQYYKSGEFDSDTAQYYLRKSFEDNKNIMFIDYECRIFQCISKGLYLNTADGKVKDIPKGMMAKIRKTLNEQKEVE